MYIINLVNKIASAIDLHETTVGVFLDLSEAFDTPNHQILFAKLEHYSIRQQFVQFNQACSAMRTIKCGVPQSSI